jgi:hypothetical protein
VVPRLRPGNSTYGNFPLGLFEWFEFVAQVPNEETPTQVPRTEETAEAPKLVEESEEDSPDDAQLPGAILQRQGSVSSLPISCGDSSEHEGPDSSKPIPFDFINNFRLIDDSISFLLPSFFARPVSTKGR